MKYDKEAYKEMVLPKVGTKAEAIVEQIKPGELRDFIDRDDLPKWKKQSPDTACIEVSAKTDKGMILRKLLVLPETDSVHPGSNLGRWKKTFGDYPFEGQEVFLIADDKGMYQFVLLE